MWGFLSGLVTSLFGSLLNNTLGSGRESEARQENYQLNEMSAANADQRTRNLYHDLQSPKALAEQYKEAGLSPSLMFGGGGVGGQTTQGAQGGGASGISPSVFGFDPMAGAQLDLLKAQVRKTNSEADAIDKKTPFEIGSIIADTDLKGAESHLRRLDAYIKDATKETTIKAAEYDLRLAEQNILYMQYHALHESAITDLAKVEAKFAEYSFEDRLLEIKTNNKLIEAQVERELMQAKLNYAQIGLVREQITSLAEHIAIDWQKTSIEQLRAGSYEEYTNAMERYLSEQCELKAQELMLEGRRLDHVVHYDWANFLKGLVQMYTSQAYSNGDKLERALIK